MKLRLIDGGRFLMGSDARERGLEQSFPLSINAQYFGNAESPAHMTWITKPYWIGRHEVTVGQWKKFVAATGYVTTAERTGKGIVGWSPTPEDKPLYQSHDFERKPGFDWKNPGFKQTENHPVVGVSFGDVSAFLKWLSQKEGVTDRLPTEAEWEFACRAGTDTWFSFGDQPRGVVHKFANVGNVELTHHGNDPKNLEELAKVDTIYQQQWAHFLDRMKSIKEADGRPLLDHCVMSYSSGMGIGHSKNRLPTAMYGGNAMGIGHQGHLKLPENTPLSTVWHTMLDRLDVDAGGEFQDSHGVIMSMVS